MSESQTGPGHAKRRSDGRRHLSDYVGVVLDHKLAVVIVFLLVVGWFAYRALVATPVYEATALVQIERVGSDNPWTAWQAPYDLEAEVGVLRSHRVARRAASGTARAPEPEAGPVPTSERDLHVNLCAVAYQRFAYRPLELFLARFTGEPERCRLELDCEPLPPGRGPRNYVIRFNDAGERFKVLDAEEENTLLVARRVDGGTPIELDGHALVVAVVEGEPDGKTYDVTLRNLVDTGRWIQLATKAAPIETYTPLVEVTFSGSTPHVAVAGAQALVDAYVAEKLARQQSQLQSQVDFLGEREDEVRKRLADAEEALDRYIMEEGAVLLSERASAILADQGSLREQRLEQEQLLDVTRRALREFREASTNERVLTLLDASRVDAKTAALASQLATAEIERLSMTEGSKLTPEDPRVQAVDVTIRETEARLTKRVEALRQRAIERLGAQIQDLEKRIQQIEADGRRWDAELDDLPREERRIAQLTRSVEASAQALEKIVTWRGESEMALQSVSARAHIADEPMLPQARTSPKLSRQLTIGILLGAFLSLFAAFFLNYLDRSVRSPSELERGLGLPLFAAIPSFASLKKHELEVAKSQVPILDAPRSVVAEAYRTLRANLRFAKAEHDIKTLTITSASPQEGKTVTTINLAIAMAETGKHVVVVDADMRRPNTHRVFGLQSVPGLGDILRHEVPWRETVLETRGAGVTLIPAGSSGPNPGALLDSDAFTELLRELGDAFDYVLFDVPPVLAVSDAAPIYRHLDAVLLLARYRRGTLEVVEGAKEKIEQLGGRVVGAIFNGFDSKRAARGSYGYYGQYGYYGRRYYGYGESDGKRRRRRSSSKRGRSGTSGEA